MNKEVIFLIEESIEGGYEARALDYSIHTQAETMDKLKNEIKDAVKCHFSEKDMPSWKKAIDRLRKEYEAVYQVIEFLINEADMKMSGNFINVPTFQKPRKQRIAEVSQVGSPHHR